MARGMAECTRRRPFRSERERLLLPLLLLVQGSRAFVPAGYQEQSHAQLHRAVRTPMSGVSCAGDLLPDQASVWGASPTSTRGCVVMSAGSREAGLGRRCGKRTEQSR